MLTMDHVLFEFDPVAHACNASHEVIKKAVFETAENILQEISVFSLEAIIIKRTMLNETELGLASFSKHCIELSHDIACSLTYKKSATYSKALAVLRHELYHFRDFENMVLRKRIYLQNNEVYNGFIFWTEFNAAFLTFSIFEDEAVYESFRMIFENNNSIIKYKCYHCSHLLGYYMQQGHAKTCELLVDKYFTPTFTKQTVDVLKLCLEKYPLIIDADLIHLDKSVRNLIANKPKLQYSDPLTTSELLTRLKTQKNEVKR